MKYLQLTLRDFFWLTIVVGLTIGIVIERNEVRSLRVYQGKAQWWEEAAKRHAKEVEEQTGIKTDFQEGAGALPYGAILMSKAPGKATGTTLYLVGQSTEDKFKPWPTGMGDLNLVLLVVLTLVAFVVVDAIRGGEKLRQAQALSNAKLRPYAATWALGGLLALSGAVSFFIQGTPFTATLMLVTSFLCAWNYWRCKQAPADEPAVAP